MRLLFLPMRGYEMRRQDNSHGIGDTLFLPMRGYEGIKSRLLCCKRNRLFLPMRGYEGIQIRIYKGIGTVISPHEGL